MHAIASQAIHQSVTQNETSVIDFGAICYESQIGLDLLVACEDHDDDEFENTRDFWGTTEDGHAWRVRIYYREG